MIVTFEFGGNLAEIIGKDTVTVNIIGNSATLGEALTQMINSYSHFHERLEKSGILSNGELKAMFVLENDLIQTENLVHHNCVIRVLPQICGG